MNTVNTANYVITSYPALRMIVLVLGCIATISGVVAIIKVFLDRAQERSVAPGVILFILGGICMASGEFFQINVESTQTTNTTNTVANNSVTMHSNFEAGHSLVESNVSLQLIICIVMVIVLLAGISYAVYSHIRKSSKENKIDE